MERANLQVQEKGEITFFDFYPPNCVFGEGAVKELNQNFLNAIEAAKTLKFIVDFANVQYMSSTVLGVLVSALLKIQNKGGELRVIGVDKDLKHLFRLTGLHRIFYICDNLNVAMDSFGKPKPAEEPEVQ